MRVSLDFWLIVFHSKQHNTGVLGLSTKIVHTMRFFIIPIWLDFPDGKNNP